MYGLALARFDRHELDHELFYCAALIHNYGAARPVEGEDFTLRSAERALACAGAAGVDATTAEPLADGICAHATPGITLARDGEIACYVQHGAMVDGAGLRAWDIAPNNITEVLSRYPRGTGFKGEFVDYIRKEARAVPEGRFALMTRCGLLLAVRLAPFDD